MARINQSHPGGQHKKSSIRLRTRDLNESENLQIESSSHGNVIIAAAAGATVGLRMAVNVAAMLIAFVALIALFNGLVGSVSSLIGLNTLLGVDAVTLELMLGKIFQPLMFLLSVPWEEAEAAGVLFGEKLILNEFVAFSHKSCVGVILPE